MDGRTKRITTAPRQRMQKLCRYCEKEFLGYDEVFSCSQQCLYQWCKHKKTKKEVLYTACGWCQKVEWRQSATVKYCSESCRKKSYYWQRQGILHEREITRLNEKKRCAYCGNPFNMRRLSQRCCSRNCYELYYKRSLVSGDKERQRARVHYWKNRDSKLAKQYKITVEQYRELTKECAICGFTEIVDCHHIVPVSEGGPDKYDNYIGLCPNHHKMIHLRGKTPQKNLEGKWVLIEKTKVYSATIDEALELAKKKAQEVEAFLKEKNKE